MKISELSKVISNGNPIEEECDLEDSYVLVNYQTTSEDEPTTQIISIHNLANIIKYDLQNAMTPIIVTDSYQSPFILDGNGHTLYITAIGEAGHPIVVYSNGQLGYYDSEGSFAAIGE